VSAVPGSRFELADAIELERADSAVQKQFKRVKEYLADKQGNEAVETLRQAMEGSGNKLLEVTDQRSVAVRRFVTVRDYCHLQLASLPAEALALYRSRVDAQAKRWYEEGIASRDRELLLRVIQQAFASSWGDKALLALGEMALERGDYTSARSYWEKIIPVSQPGDGPRTWLSVPNTDVDLAAVRARLVLVSILEGSAARARDELAQMAKLHPAARGRLGGEERNYVEALTAMLAESSQWPKPLEEPGWPTFAGSPERNRVVGKVTDSPSIAWRLALPPAPPGSASLWGSGIPARRVAEDSRAPLSYFPVLAGNLLLVNNQYEILAVDARTGKPAWSRGEAEIFRDPLDEAGHAQLNPPDDLGVPRFTMTVRDGKLYARMGSGVTSRPPGSPLAADAGYLVALDLEAEGRPIWNIVPESKDWAFEGSPVSDGASIYVAMRRSDIRGQSHVACYDAETGTLRWRRFIVAAETPARGAIHETTSNLLTLDHDTLYLNTNLGAVAALSTRDGQVKWISLYPRVRQGDLLNLDPHWCRDLTPCLFDRGRLLVAPADSRRIFALDAGTGQMLWETNPKENVEDAVHLLGVVGDTLIAAGNRIYWIDLGDRPGRVKAQWPEGEGRLGYGRGLVAADGVLWPTRENLYVFDPQTGRQKSVISLAARGASGGNLLAWDRYLMIAGNKELVAFGPAAAEAKRGERPLARVGGRGPGAGGREERRVAIGEWPVVSGRCSGLPVMESLNLTWDLFGNYSGRGKGSGSGLGRSAVSFFDAAVGFSDTHAVGTR
jgi:outer membrane protein assembly factor BamB